MYLVKNLQHKLLHTDLQLLKSDFRYYKSVLDEFFVCTIVHKQYTIAHCCSARNIFFHNNYYYLRLRPKQFCVILFCRLMANTVLIYRWQH